MENNSSFASPCCGYAVYRFNYETNEYHLITFINCDYPDSYFVETLKDIIVGAIKLTTQRKIVVNHYISNKEIPFRMSV